MQMTEYIAEGLGVKVTITESAGLDGAVVIFIDTDFEPSAIDGGPGLRVLINDDPTYEGVPWRGDPTEYMSEEELAAHNEAMNDPLYREAMLQERN